MSSAAAVATHVMFTLRLPPNKNPRTDRSARGLLREHSFKAAALLHHTLNSVDSRDLLRERFPRWIEEAQLLKFSLHQCYLVA